ncbi:Ctr copper transporter [Xylaria acuta]|nr:Ctr copper transporter [Xylaria acuta]
MEMDSMGGMDGTQPPSHACKISMLWNWETIDTCFLSESWQIHSRGAFAGFCIGVILLVVLLEFFRHAARRYDQYLVAKHPKDAVLATESSTPPSASGPLNAKDHQVTHTAVSITSFRPCAFQQAIRALLHTLQFATAYWIMLLAMYFNGYIIICIIIGAFIGSFIFQWGRLDGCSTTASSSNVREAAGCCA